MKSCSPPSKRAQPSKLSLPDYFPHPLADFGRWAGEEDSPSVIFFLPSRDGHRRQVTNHYHPETEPLIAGKSLATWDKKWVELPGGFKVPHQSLIGMAGLFRAVENGETVVIGKGAGRRENRLDERLGDLRREGDSGHRYDSGRFIYANMDRLKLEVLVTGDDREACDAADKLLRPMLIRHRPRENAPVAIVDRIIRSAYQ